FFAALAIGRLLKRRSGVCLSLLFRLFCLALAFYTAMWVYRVPLQLRTHIGSAAALLSTAFIVALVNRYVWDFYFEKKRQTPIPHFLREVVAGVIFLVALLLVLWYGYHAERWLTGLLAGSGVAAIILGFAGQNLFGGIIAGISLQINRPYRVGDWLQLGERFAEVMEINWRSTRLRTNDAIYLDIPNNEIVKQTIVNLHYPTERHPMRSRVGLGDRGPPNLLKNSKMDYFGRGEAVIEEGAEGESLFILLRGTAHVTVVKQGTNVRVGGLRPGDCFGEMSLLTGERRSATVRAEGDCYVMEISKPVMAEVLRDSPQCLEQLSELLARRKMENEGILKDAAIPANQVGKAREYKASFLKRLRTVFEL